MRIALLIASILLSACAAPMKVSTLIEAGQSNQFRGKREYGDTTYSISGTLKQFWMQSKRIVKHEFTGLYDDYAESRVVKRTHPVVLIEEMDADTAYLAECHFEKRHAEQLVDMGQGGQITVTGVFKRYHGSPNGLVAVFEECELSE